MAKAHEQARATRTREERAVGDALGLVVDAVCDEHLEGGGKGALDFLDLCTRSFLHLLAQVLERGQKGLSIQRYKGLGEMNPDQLAETTMNPESRTLMQVKIEDVVEANTVFETLMGDDVEPRREFIEANALNVQNLDI